MKYFISALLFFFAAAISAQALTPQDLVGSWKSKDVQTESDDNVKMYNSYEFTFKSDGNVDMKCNITMTLDVGQKVLCDSYMYLTGSGQYTTSADSLIVVIDRNTINMDVPIDEIRIRGVVSDQTRENKMRTYLYDGLVKSFSLYVNQLNLEFTLTDMIVDNKKFTCIDEGQKLTFKRLKTSK